MQNNTSKKQLPGFLVLTIIAIAAALLLGLTNAVTAGPIEQHRMEALNAAYNAVMPAASYEAISIPQGYKASGLYAAKDESGNVLGYCVTAASKGYAGDVAMTFGVDPDGKVTGVVVGDTSFAETDGFGARAKEDSFREQFVGLDAVNGGSFLPLSGATFTSKAVLAATNEALRAVSDIALGKPVDPNGVVSFGEKVAVQADASSLVPGASLKGEAEGYGGANVIVKIKLGDDATIASIKVDASTQTPGIGQRCVGEEFTAQFIGKSIPVEGIDVLSGATITSNAVIEAVNGAQPSDEEEPAEEAVTVVTEKDGVTIGVTESGKLVVTGAKSPVTVTLSMDGDKIVGAEFHEEAVEASADAGFFGSAKGFAGDVQVNVTVNPDGTVVSVVVKADNETPGIGQECMKESFTKQFIGKNGPFNVGENIDAISGATVTSKAVAKAVNVALASAPAIEPVPGVGSKRVVDEQTSIVKGFQSDVTVIVNLNDDKTIAAMTVKAEDETAGLGQECMKEAFTKQFIGKTAPFTVGKNIDAVSGATVTSKAVCDAVNQIFTAIPAGEPAADAVEYTAVKEGYESDVKVIVTVNADCSVATLKVKAEYETAGIGQRCMEPEFVDQFIGKKGPFVVGENVDVLSGATYTSKAVIAGVNQALKNAEAAAPAPAVTAAPAAEVVEYTAVKEGYESDVKIIATVNEDGTVATLVIKAEYETAGIGQRCMEPEFVNRFIGKKAPFVIGENVDVLAGATYTSKAVIAGLNQALANVAPAEAPAAVVYDTEKQYTAVKEGYESDVKIIATVNADGTIATLTIKAEYETAGIGQRCMEPEFVNQFIGKKAPFVAGENVDVLSGATYTSKAVIAGLNQALGQ